MMNARSLAVTSILAALATTAIACSSGDDLPNADPTPDGGVADGGRKKDDAGPPAAAECTRPEDCPAPEGECVERACNAGKCEISPKAEGTDVAAQTAGDCKRQQCDGAGKVVAVNDGKDAPVDGNDCTDDVCIDGVPSNPAKKAGDACGKDLALKCDGAGKCVGCLVASDCAGTDTDCSARTCNAGTCGTKNIAAGTAVTNQTAGDCKKVVCDGAGKIKQENDDTDIPNDNIECTIDACEDGVASHPPMSGATCNENGGARCNDQGMCVIATCINKKKDGDETDIDCGGACPKCATGGACATNDDCKSNVCTSSVCTAPPQGCATGTVVISQVYGGSGSAGPAFASDFVELYNRGTSAVDLSGWSVQYASKDGNFSSVIPLAGTIPAGGYYLVKGIDGKKGGAALPAADATGSVDMAGAAGKVALVMSATKLTTCTSADIVDVVKYGATTNTCSTEGTKAPALGATTAALRGDNGCTKTGADADFTAVLPAPRNSSTPVYLCTCN